MSEIEDLKAILEEEELANELAFGSEIDGFKRVAEVSKGSGRWYEYIQVVTQGPSGQLYGWEYGQGLTEVQENDFYSIEPPVKLRAIEKVITVTEYVSE
jgi:hypothetical protein